MSYKLSSNRLHDGYLSARVTQFDDDRRHPTRQKRLLLYPRRFLFFGTELENLLTHIYSKLLAILILK